jgi:hypothetical protein
MNPFAVQPDKMGAVFPAVFSDAVIDAEQVRISAVYALAQRNTNLRNREVARAANGEKVLTGDVVFAFPQIGIVLDKTKDPASHEYMGMSIMICLDLLKALIHPIDAVSAVDHCTVKRLWGLIMAVPRWERSLFR